MSLRVLKSGPQATLQAAPRIGLRHLGVPASGAVDRLSHALANRLVGNALDAPAIEVTLGGFEARCETSAILACTGAHTEIKIDQEPVELHSVLKMEAGKTLSIGYPSQGCRSYVSIAGAFAADDWLGSGSTYLPAAVGGFGGRALRAGDLLVSKANKTGVSFEANRTPADNRPPITESWALRAIPDPGVPNDVQEALFSGTFQLSNRTSRMGGALEGESLVGIADSKMPSTGVFPGSIQCPPDGRPFLLMADAQTTGGYPLVAQVIRADRHLMGQVRPGDRVRFFRTTPDAAAAVLRQKTALFEGWLESSFHFG
ncbi:MAG: biotin-dependent carboxyltransferase family protein [Pseudomonadota bacterium]